MAGQSEGATSPLQMLERRLISVEAKVGIVSAASEPGLSTRAGIPAQRATAEPEAALRRRPTSPQEMRNSSAQVAESISPGASPMRHSSSEHDEKRRQQTEYRRALESQIQEDHALRAVQREEQRAGTPVRAPRLGTPSVYGRHGLLDEDEKQRRLQESAKKAAVRAGLQEQIEAKSARRRLQEEKDRSVAAEISLEISACGRRASGDPGVVPGRAWSPMPSSAPPPSPYPDSSSQNLPQPSPARVDPAANLSSSGRRKEGSPRAYGSFEMLDGDEQQRRIDEAAKKARVRLDLQEQMAANAQRKEAQDRAREAAEIAEEALERERVGICSLYLLVPSSSFRQKIICRYRFKVFV